MAFWLFWLTVAIFGLAVAITLFIFACVAFVQVSRHQDN